MSETRRIAHEISIAHFWLDNWRQPEGEAFMRSIDLKRNYNLIVELTLQLSHYRSIDGSRFD